eukprot:6174719-Pleurochrysis_carterae.AAC.2
MTLARLVCGWIAFVLLTRLRLSQEKSLPNTLGEIRLNSGDKQKKFKRTDRAQRGVKIASAHLSCRITGRGCVHAVRRTSGLLRFFATADSNSETAQHAAFTFDVIDGACSG